MKDVYARQSPQEPISVDKAHRYSFFDLVKNLWRGQNSYAMHRLCTLMRKMDARWLIKEEVEIESLLEEEVNAIKRRCGKDTICEATRLTFFSDMPKKDLMSEKASKALLAYVVIIKVHFPKKSYPSNPKDRIYIFEAVVGFPSILLNHETTSLEGMTEIEGSLKIPVTNYYYHCGGTFETTIGTKSKHTNYIIHGTYFAQQNHLTSVCAHACIQMAINNAGALGAPKITSERINQLLKIDHTTPKTRVGHFKLDENDMSIEKRTGGVTTHEIIRVVKQLGLGTLFAKFIDPQTPECYRWLYPHLESSFPTILGIQRPRHSESEQMNHVVVILGHTLNTDRWEPEARFQYRELVVWPYYSTGDWVDHFIINDDNLGMGRTISTDQLRDTQYRKKQGKLHPGMAISIVPKEVISTGINAEYFASVILGDLLKAMRGKEEFEWLRVLTHSKVTCRTFTSTADDYIKHLSQCEDNLGHKITHSLLKEIRKAIPDLVWLTEISVPDLVYGNKAKLGDVVAEVDFEYTGKLPHDLEAIKFISLPGAAIFGLAPETVVKKWPLTGYIPLQRAAHSNLPQVEW